MIGRKEEQRCEEVSKIGRKKAQTAQRRTGEFGRKEAQKGKGVSGLS